MGAHQLASCETCPREDVLGQCSPASRTKTFTTILHDLQQQHVPHRTYTTSPKDQPCFGYRSRIAAKRKYSQWQRYKRHPIQCNRALHQTACKVMLQTTKWVKTEWEDNNGRMLSSNQMDPKR